MTNLERLKSLKPLKRDERYEGNLVEDFNFLLKSFWVMRELAIEKLFDCEYLGDIEEYFEERMNREEKK